MGKGSMRDGWLGLWEEGFGRGNWTVVLQRFSRNRDALAEVPSVLCTFFGMRRSAEK